MSLAFSTLTKPALRRGFRVVRRDDRHLQLGLDPPERRILPAVDGLQDTLTALERRLPLPRSANPDVRRVLDELTADGWIVESAPQPSTPAGQAADGRVVVVADAVVAPAVLRGCAAAGLDVASPSAPDLPRLVVTLGEPRRRLSDELMREDLPQVWLAFVPDGVRIGPFVRPGLTACLRCVDAHLGDRDHRRATVLHQLEHAADALPAPADPSLVSIGVAWAVRDLVRTATGEPADLASATVHISADLGVSRRTWLRHAHCGCAWG